MRALVVDDSAAFVELVSNILCQGGLEVASVRDGEDGLAAFQLGDFDIVITDIMMPEGDGIEMAERIRAVSADVPIVMVAAADNAEYMARARQAGATAYLLKPTEGMALETTVEELVMFHHFASA